MSGLLLKSIKSGMKGKVRLKESLIKTAIMVLRPSLLRVAGTSQLDPFVASKAESDIHVISD